MKPTLKKQIPFLIAALCCSAAPRLALAQTEASSVVTDCDRAAASDYDKQSPAAGVPFNEIDPKVAIPACIEAVARNPDSARLRFELGRAYDADKNYAEALKSFRKAAESSFALAQVNLGALYFNGQGVEKDYGEAAKWDRLAAGQGLAPAQAALGALYVSGQGVTQDYIEAEKWLRLAAAQGFARAQNSLAALYANGQGVERNYAEARKWYASAAAQGYAPARASLDALNAAAGLDNESARDAGAPADGSAASLPRAKPDPNAPRYIAGPPGADYSPVKIDVKSPDSRVSNRVAATAIEISPASPNFSMTSFAVNKGNCHVYIEDPTALLRSGKAGENAEREAEFEQISLMPPPFNPPVAARLGQYMTFYVDPSACAIEEVEVLVNGFEWKWTPG
jgi:TPR repeat protein